MDEQEGNDLDGQDKGPPQPERGTPEFRAQVTQTVKGSASAWHRWRGMLLGKIPHDRWEVDGKLERVRSDEETERLMWLHAQSVLGSLAWLERLDREAAGDRDPGPHPSDVLEFVSNQILCALDGHPPRLFRDSIGNVTGAMERNCIVFAKSYEEFAGNRDMAAETAPDGTRLLPDDDATAEIHRAYHLTAATYKAAKAKLRPEDTVIFHWFHPGAFRYELGNMPADQRLAHARKRIKEVGDAYQWARADRLIGMPRNARAAAQEGGEAIRPAGKREERKK